jgi:hypothetical protein
MKKIILVVFVLLLGCSGKAQPHSIENLFVSSKGQAKQLPEVIKLFNHNLYWGSLEQAAEYIVPENRSQFVRNAKSKRETEKLVDLEIGYIDFSDNNDSATVDIKVKYYRVPNYIIETRYDQQRWSFSRYSGGWLLENYQLDVATP